MITSAPCQFLQAGAQSRLFRSETAEHQSFPCVEEGSLSGTLVFDCGHDNNNNDRLTAFDPGQPWWT